MNGAKVRQQIAFSVLGGITLLIVVPIILVILYIVIKPSTGRAPSPGSS